MRTIAETTGVILAAGKGTRILPFSEVLPKPLLPVCNRPIMAYHLDLFAQLGIQDVVIVIGPHGERIRETFGNGRHLGLRLTYVVDERPEGIASSLLRTESFVAETFVVILGDIFLPLPSLRPLVAPVVERVLDGSVLVVQEPDAALISRNFAVEVGTQNMIRRVVEKPPQPATDLKGCGFYVFRRSIFDAIRQTPRSALRNEFELTDAIQRLIDDGQELIAVDGEQWDVNITSPADLLDCNLRVLAALQKPFIIGKGASLPDDLRLSHAVIGDHVVVDWPISIERSLILPNSHIDVPDASIVRTIVAPHATVVVG